MKIKIYSILMYTVLIGIQTMLFAGTTGKIAGVVKDMNTGEVLPGVNIIVDYTPLGAAADLKGNFVIINVPPGSYRLRITMIGYKTHLIDNVRVSIDLTTTVNVSMESTVLEAGEEVTIVAERPLVRLDMTSSLSSVSAQEIRQLPVQTINDVLELQAGIVQSNGLHIRGGRASEVAYWVDGVATTDVFNYSSSASIENAAVQELQVISGTFNAEYGQAMSGIINIITKEGSPQYHGQLKGYLGDYLSTSNIYDVLSKVIANYDSTTQKTSVREISENPLKKFNATYDGEFSLSGPVPLLGKHLTFFTNGRYYSDEGYLYGREWYKPTGIPGDSSLVPMNPTRRYSMLGKLTYKMSNSLKASYSLNFSDWLNERSFQRNFKYVPGGVPQDMGNTMTHLLSINHVLSPSTFYEFKISNMKTEYKNYLYENFSATPHWLVRVEGDSTRASYTFDPKTTEGAAELQQIEFLGTPHAFIADPNGPDGYVHPDSATEPASYSYYRAGTGLNRTFRSTAYWIGKLDLTSQINNSSQIKAGFELRLHELSLDTYELQAKTVAGKAEQIVPFTPAIPSISTVYHDKYNRKPRELSAYIQDKVELKDIIMNLGLRFDYFDANSVKPADPADPNIYYPFKPANIWKNPDDPDSLRVEYTAEQRRAFMQKKVDPKMQFSPRLGIAYPITDKGVIHFSYGHFFQIPEFQYLYDVPDFKLNTGGGRSIIGNADLKPQRTIQYEIGLQQEVYKNVGVNIALFYRDVRDWVGTSPLIQTYKRVISYSIYENRDYENVRGVNLILEKRYSNNFYAKLDYSFQVAEGTYSNPTDAFNAELAKQEPRINLIPMGWDQRQTLNAQVMVGVKNWTISLIGKYRTGLPYTPSFAQGSFVGGNALTGLRENSSRNPDINSVDIYITRRFEMDFLNFSFFVYAYNVFDQRCESSVFSDTGTAAYTTYPVINEIQYTSNRVGTVRDLYTRPEMYITPRQVQVGMTIEF